MMNDFANHSPFLTVFQSYRDDESVVCNEAPLRFGQKQMSGRLNYPTLCFYIAGCEYRRRKIKNLGGGGARGPKFPAGT